MDRYVVTSFSASAGFPSPAERWSEKLLDLGDILVQHPESTFFVRAQGSSMVLVSIHDGDILVVDCALPAVHGNIIVASLHDAFVVKRLLYQQGKIFLKSEHSRYPTFAVILSMHFKVWGMVVAVIRPLHEQVRHLISPHNDNPSVSS